MKNIIYEDTTLRDGEQAPGYMFDQQTKIEIFSKLYNAGVRWFEVGIPAMGGEELETLKELLAVSPDDAKLLAWNRGNIDDINTSLDLGFKYMHVGLPVSDVHITNSIKKDKKWLLKTAKEMVQYVKDKDCYLSISAEDVGRADISFLQEYAGIITEAGANRLRLSDTVGVLGCEEYGNIVKKVREVTSIDIQCHTHNDFGLAVANTISGLKAGANFFHATINGIGERAGMPDILQVALALFRIYNVDLGLNYIKLIEASDYLKSVTNTECLPWTPIIGENVFSHESGIHVNGMLKNSNTFEPIDPNILGKKSKFMLGKHSGRATIDYYLRKYNISASDYELKQCLSVVRQKAIDNKRIVSGDELVDIYNKLFFNSIEN